MLVRAYCEYAQRHRCCFMEWPGVELFSTSANGDSIHHSLEQLHASAVGPSAAVVAACEVFRRNELPGSEAHHAHSGPAYGLRKRSLPKHGGMLGTSHRNLHDIGQHLHPCMRILRRAKREALRP